MSRRSNDNDIDDIGDEAQAQIESLQTAAADAEARAATAKAELQEHKQLASRLESELAEAQAARESALGELGQLRPGLTSANAGLREAAAKYREARLAAAPEVPQDLVPAAEAIEQVERDFEAAKRLVGRVRDSVQEEAREQLRSARVPAGAPARRAPDLSALSAEEKIKLGLQQQSERQAR